MSKKKKSPVTESLEGLWSCYDQLEQKEMKKAEFVKAIQVIKWNLLQGASQTSDVHHWQALGVAKGVLLGLGENG